MTEIAEKQLVVDRVSPPSFPPDKAPRVNERERAGTGENEVKPRTMPN